MDIVLSDRPSCLYSKKAELKSFEPVTEMAMPSIIVLFCDISAQLTKKNKQKRIGLKPFFVQSW